MWRSRAAAVLLALLLSACTELPPASAGAVPDGFEPRTAPQRLIVGVLIAGWHTGLLIPTQELGPLRQLLPGLRASGYLNVGWGNRRFYMAAHPGSGDALAALFRSGSVVLAQSVANPLEALPPDGRIDWLCIDRAQLWRLDAYLSLTLQWRAGHPVDLGPGPLPDSRFYASGAHYDALHTCNTWTLAALQYAGLAVSGEGVLFAGQVARRLGALPMCAVG